MFDNIRSSEFLACVNVLDHWTYVHLLAFDLFLCQFFIIVRNTSGKHWCFADACVKSPSIIRIFLFCNIRTKSNKRLLWSSSRTPTSQHAFHPPVPQSYEHFPYFVLPRCLNSILTGYIQLALSSLDSFITGGRSSCYEFISIILGFIRWSPSSLQPCVFQTAIYQHSHRFILLEIYIRRCIESGMTYMVWSEMLFEHHLYHISEILYCFCQPHEWPVSQLFILTSLVWKSMKVILYRMQPGNPASIEFTRCRIYKIEEKWRSLLSQIYSFNFSFCCVAFSTFRWSVQLCWCMFPVNETFSPELSLFCRDFRRRVVLFKENDSSMGIILITSCNPPPILNQSQVIELKPQSFITCFSH